jgi:hypothetical protein
VKADSLSIGRGILEEGVSNSGRPVIVVPPVAGQFAMRRALIGWDDSSQATRALNDALAHPSKPARRLHHQTPGSNM